MSHNDHYGAYDIFSGSDSQGQIITIGIFTNYANHDYSLLEDTSSGYDISSLIPAAAVDMLGNRYDANGGWTRGAIAYTGGFPAIVHKRQRVGNKRITVNGIELSISQ